MNYDENERLTDITDEELDEMNKQELIELRELVNEEIKNIKTQLSLAFAKRYPDKFWLAKASQAKDERGHLCQRIESRLSFLKQEKQEDRGQLFMTIAKRVLPEEMWDRIMTEVFLSEKS